MELLKTELYSFHKDLNAKMAPFAGFEMPIQYTSVKEEVYCVRNAVGVFDVSHMGEFFIEGDDAESMADYLVPNLIKGIGEGKAVYSPLCRENGTIVDDLIVYKISNKKILLCVNASNVQKDWEHIQKVKSSTKFNCTIVNKSNDYSLLAIQGPKASKVLIDLGVLTAAVDAESGYYSVTVRNWKGKEIIAARTGYTGEDGFELFCDHETAKTLWKLFMEVGVVPCGLAARDVLRLEVCYPLYGHELSDEVTPLDSGLKWTVKSKESGFVGMKAIAEYKPKLQLVKLMAQEGVPRQGYIVEDKNGKEVGVVVSGTMSPTLNKGIALAHLHKDKMSSGEKTYWIVIRGKRYEAIVQDKAFITGGHK